jgi:hypothetical protein
MKTCFIFALLTFVSNSVLSQNSGYFDISTTVDVQFIVTDPLGRRTGVDPRGASNPMQGIEINEIPGANYSTSSVGDSPLPDYEPIKSDFSFEFNYIISVPQNDGVYTIQTIGTTSSDYNMDVHVKSEPKSTIQSFDINIHGVTDINKVARYRFTYFGMPGGEIKFEKVVTGTTLLEDISAMKKVNWISTQAVADKYTGFFNTYNAQMQQNNFSGARTTLDTVIQNLVADSTTVITGDAYKSLRLDTDQLLNQLPPHTCTVKLLSSTGSLLTTGALQYRDSTWKDATNNNDGTFTIITARKKVSLSMTYEYGTQTKSNVPVKNDTTIIFQTKNVAVNLQNSTGTPLDTGVVQYNANGWQDFGTTSNGVVTKELLPTKYTFRMTYNSATVSKAQNIDSNATVIFQTVPAKVQLQTSTGVPLDTGIVQYNSGGWKNFGTTLNGAVTKELLPTKYNFRMTYDGATVNKAQSIDSNATIIFQTVKTMVQFNNSRGNPIDTGKVQFNSGGWQNFGSIFNGVASKELLPIKYTFKLTYNGSAVSLVQSIDSSATVVFSTVLCTVQVTKISGVLLNNATVSYNAGGWNVIGTTVNGIVTKEFLPVKIQFRAAYGTKQQSVTQDVSINPLIPIILPVQ